MTNLEFLQKFIKLQYQIGYDKFYKVDGSTIVYSKTDNSIYSNYAFVQSIINKENLTKIEDIFESLNRTPTIYFENSHEFDPLLTLLSSEKYIKRGEDSWMFHSGNKMDDSRFNQVKIVENKKDLETFLNTFDLSYQKDDPQNPYGEVKSFIPSCRNAWIKFGNTNRLNYYIAFKNNIPVATSILNCLDGVGYISAVGSIKAVRGEGFGKLATLYAVNESKKYGNSLHCLATEEGNYPNEFYKRIGFETKFTALVYSKK